MTYDAVRLLPRSVLFGDPEYAGPCLSPDGTLLGFLAPYEGVLNIWVGPVGHPGLARPVTRDRHRGIRAYGFCHDNTTLFYLKDEDGDENWRLYLLDLTYGEERCVTPHKGVQAQVLAHNSWHPTRMLLGLNRDRPEFRDVFELDLVSGQLVQVCRNPGFFGWLVDTDLRVRGGFSYSDDGGKVLHLGTPEAGFRPWKRIPQGDAGGSGFRGFSRDGSSLYFTSSVGANTSRLFVRDTTSGAETEIAGDPSYDVRGVTFDPDSQHVQAVTFEKERLEWQFLDTRFEHEVRLLREVLATEGAPDGELDIQRNERSSRLWNVTVRPSDGPLHLYVYDRDDGRLQLLFHHAPALARAPLAAMEPFNFVARDGLAVHGYVTYPLGVPRTALPAVVNVHGGPEARTSWGFSSEAQWLANRGYACIQVNYRGSSGYGKAFVNAGDKQWGRDMQTDLLDAVDHLASLGTIDADRVGILGASYGGYAALAGAAFTPGAFRCAVALCGPSNLLTLLESTPAYWKPALAYQRARIGDPETEHDRLWDQSPLSRVEDISIPILIAHGANDPRVSITEAEQIVGALRRKGLAHEFLLFEDEGHGLARPANRMRYYAAVERFLADHLGGRAES
ncbi:alpha/beta fold hydrolase [Streptomyces sp. NPDC015232]|uniref:S9 family peptidase n=1 Tax=unclassified Streptomyces TaxID=2593676 RepID=UPI0036FD4B3D